MICSVCGQESKSTYFVNGRRSCSSTKCLSKLYLQEIENVSPEERYATVVHLTKLRQRKIRRLRECA